MYFNREDKKGIMFLSFVGIVFLTLVAITIYFTNNENEYDETTYCRINHIDKATFVIVDKTDSWDAIAKERISKVLVNINNTLSPYERLFIYMLETTGVPNQPLFNLCNPMRGDQVSPVYKNPRRVQKRYNELFVKPFKASLDAIVEPSKADRTRLIETLISLRKFAVKVEKPRIIMISDMMENSAMISLYKDSPTYEEWINRPDNTEYNFIGNVEIYYLDRTSISEQRKVRAKVFWKSLFEDTNIPHEWLDYDFISI